MFPLRNPENVIDKILMSADKLKDKSPLIDKMFSNKYISFQDDTDVDEENDDIIVKAFNIEQDIDEWAKFHKNSGKEIFEIQDSDDEALILVASIFSQDWTERFLAEKFGEDVSLKERKYAREEIFIKPVRRIPLTRLSEEKKIKEEIVKAPREVEELKKRTPDVPEEKVDIAKEAASELRELLESVEKLSDQIKADEKDAQTRIDEFLQARGTEESKRKLQNDMDRLTAMLHAAGGVVKINAEKIAALVEKTEVIPILSEAVVKKLKALKAEHKKIEKEYEEKAGVQMEEVRKTITQRIVEFPIKPELFKNSTKQAFLKDILKKIWGFISGWLNKLHDFSEEIDELQVMIEEEASKGDLGEVYRGK